jgi:cytoskeleton protein RodZ
MSDPIASAPQSAGALLRTARESRGISLDHLASLLKVPEAKLAALEEGRYDALPGLAFVRALAQTVCRQLEIEAQPVLEALPKLVAPAADLEHLNRGLATPFQVEQTRLFPGLPVALPGWLRPGVLGPAVLLVLAAGFWFGPGTGSWKRSGTAAADAASSAEFSVSTVSLASGALAASAPPAGVGAVGAITAGALASAPVGRDPGSAPAVVGAGSSITVVVPPASAIAATPASPVTTPATGAVVLRAVKASWVEVRDANAVLVSRLIAEGEVVPLDGVAPFKVKIGNASGVEVQYRGQAVDLAASTKDNVARLELK